ncbi:hypothetical protein [Acidiferrobacter sp.]|jgi:cytochrome c-type biogenesis protein CcmH|uniref:TPR domain-containing protein n=1 Tax=Acidiferrobacter sp. TaxID=1872107 RepID=UPI0026191EF8|nr:hypothetical protein [Acidiferrobacter sp.]
MFVIIVLSAVLALFSAWFLTRPIKGRAAVEGDRLALELTREETLKQLHEIESDRSDGRIDESVAREETARLKYALAQTLRALEAGEGAAPAGSDKLRRRGAVLVGLLVVLTTAAAGMDYWQNRPALLTFATLNAKGRVSGVHGFPPMILSMVARLRRHLVHHPRDTAGWLELARANVVLGNLKGARAAYARAYHLAPDDEAVLANYAWILYSAHPTKTTGRVYTLFRRLYKQDSHQQDALWFLGLASYNRHHFHKTLMYWAKLEKELPPGSKARNGVTTAVSKIRAILAAEHGRAPAGAGPQAPAATP